ncbi:MAG: histone deacetylase [Ignavibacteriales bacterium]|nr:MAG: histone deacetylase [Ignavibacteriales bacterium]
MSKRLFISSEKMLGHIPPFTHAERPERLQSLLAIQLPEGYDRIDDYPRVTDEQLLQIHDRAHLEYIRSSVISGAKLLDEGDTYSSPGSLDAAYMAAGAGITAVDKVFTEGYNSVFCAVRPPGHHAEKNRVMGFCYFGNVAAAVRYAQSKGYIKRAAIVDWDVHHGNGTQDIFYSDSSVLFFSIHQMPLWPGTGYASEQGEGEGKGYTVNLPVKPHTTGDVYTALLREQIIPRINEFKPDCLFISAGFDAHEDDPLAQVALNEQDYAEMTKLLKSCADSLGIPVISMLEGGYNLTALANSVKRHLEHL